MHVYIDCKPSICVLSEIYTHSVCLLHFIGVECIICPFPIWMKAQFLCVLARCLPLEMSKHVFTCMGVLFRISILYFLLTWHMEEEMQKPCYASCLFSGLST